MENKPLSLLLVEDDDTHVQMVRNSFEHADVDVSITRACAIEDAHVLIRDMHFDVIVTDLRLPDGSGLELLKEKNECQSPIIIMTSHGGEEAAVEAMKAGAFDYVVKRDSTFSNMPQIVKHVLHEWHNSESYKRAEKVLKENEHRLMLALEAAKDGMWDYTLASKELYVSARWFSLLGYDVGEITPTIAQWLLLVYGEDKERVSDAFEEALAGATDMNVEYRMKAKDGSLRWVLTCGKVVGWDDTGHAKRLVGTQTDITARKEIEEKLEKTAHHDMITGLPNRAMFLEYLDKALKRSERNAQYQCAVIFLDLDKFKVVNDSFGHFAGDALLADIAVRLSVSMRGNDIVARFAGDEFTILVDDIKAISQVLEVVKRIQESLRESFVVEGETVHVSCSMGVVLSSSSYISSEDMLRDADDAMYKAKSLGRDRFEVFNEHMHVHTMTQLQLESDIRRSIENNDFFVEYEPIVDTLTGRLVGAQALLRWNHPEEGVVLPSLFLPQVESEELSSAYRIVECGFRAIMSDLNSACARHDFFRVLFDLSLVHVKDHRFVQRLEAMAHNLHFDLSSLVFVFHEPAAATSDDFLCQRVVDLQKVVPNIAINDFASGYSPLLFLKRLPINMIKVDGGFIRNVVGDSRGMDVLKAVISTSKAMRVTSIADDVQTREHYDMLSRIGCDWVQGSIVGMPVQAKEIRKMLDDEHVFV